MHAYIHPYIHIDRHPYIHTDRQTDRHTLLDHSLNGAFQGEWKQIMLIEQKLVTNPNGQLVEGLPAGYLQAWRS